ncbi:2-isopropylmalate synthase [Antrihabitans sp. YC3-6]|uniref:2-isopropylmalate synthase n=1 Tax=Antrihabitans stalagmiti TaxID=2799499 RepID=A0A934U246_9NOCA|nr:alpha-isopropylmalate synthase regulatory domain-containing protein [Antrihabitans stalagmiti]MBJ8337923.1 2-isopropylmalate synthase [Antrihabitans stalagmiti]
MNTITRFSTASSDPFTDRFSTPLPRALRAESAGLTWNDFLERYSPIAGRLRLAGWTVDPRSTGLRDYEATLDIDGRSRCTRVSAPGPIAALSSILYDAGCGVEVLSFHQQSVAEGTATFVYCEHNGRRHWAMAIAADGVESALRAIIAGVNILVANQGCRRSA